MNMLFRCATRLTVIGAFAAIAPTFAAASDIEQSPSFKLAMGPMSAAQKNQSQDASANSGQLEIQPRPHTRPHRHLKHRHHSR